MPFPINLVRSADEVIGRHPRLPAQDPESATKR